MPQKLMHHAARGMETWKTSPSTNTSRLTPRQAYSLAPPAIASSYQLAAPNTLRVLAPSLGSDAQHDIVTPGRKVTRLVCIP